MQNPIGLLILIVFCAIIIKFRSKIETSDNVYLKRAAKIGDWFVWFRFIMGLLLLAFGLLIFSKVRH